MRVSSLRKPGYRRKIVLNSETYVEVEAVYRRIVRAERRPDAPVVGVDGMLFTFDVVDDRRVGV